MALTYPSVQALTAWPLHVWYRFVTLLFSLGSIIFLYLIGRQLFNLRVGLITAAFMAFLPYSLYYSRTILPEIPSVCLALACLYFGLSVLKRPQAWRFGLITFTGALALLLKPTSLFLLLPLAVTAVFILRRRPHLTPAWFFCLLAITLPLYFWRQWISYYPEGIPYAVWLYNGNGIRLRPAWFRWLFYERLTKLVLGSGLLPLFLIGLWSGIVAWRRLPSGLTSWFNFSLGLGTLAYLIVFATGNVQHDYYQIITLPFVCLILAHGLDFILSTGSRPLRWLALVSLGLGWFLSWRLVSGYYQINHWSIVHAGQTVDRLTSPDALVIAPYFGDTAFLYQTNRRGWPLGRFIDEKITDGADYYVTVNRDEEANDLRQRYPLVAETEEYLILRLQP